MSVLGEMLSMTFSIKGTRAERRMSRFASSQLRNSLNFFLYRFELFDHPESCVIMAHLDSKFSINSVIGCHERVLWSREQGRGRKSEVKVGRKSSRVRP